MNTTKIFVSYGLYFIASALIIPMWLMHFKGSFKGMCIFGSFALLFGVSALFFMIFGGE
jgi:hypothetical protein